MKERFTTIDLFASVEYFNRRLLGMRVANIYDIDHKTYLLKLSRSEEKIMLLFESGCRIHTTEFEWPKNIQPSGFAMKLRKHLRTKRLVGVTQLGIDRVVDLQFGSGEYAHHLIIELYDRGNVILTDHTYLILSLLRTRTDADSDVRFATRETFSMDTIKQGQPQPTLEQVKTILSSTKPGDQLKHLLNPHYVYGPALLTHCLLGAGLPENSKIGTDINTETDTDKILTALTEAHTLFETLRSQPCKGYLIQKKESTLQVTNGASSTGSEDLVTNVEFHPILLRQHITSCYKEFETFDKAVDEFFSSKSSQKQDLKVVQMQKTALKKLDNIRQDHEKRIDALRKNQEEDIYKAHLIELNTDLVERTCIVIRSAIANAMDWGDIELLVRDAQTRGDPVAGSIHSLKLQSNQITLLLKEPFDSEDEEDTKPSKKKKGIKVDIDLSLSAYSNARRYYDQKKQAARKEQKTADASYKALKSAEKKTKQSLKEAAVVSRIIKARKVYWFEKFFWFISSENYLVIGGRDQQQNELLVKKYLNENDLYVHADLHGATSVIIKNDEGGPVPPKTLNEAGVMAVCYSSAWEAKIVTSAWWVYSHQVSKTAPSGEYLTTGSFMIRGKKNFVPPCHLTLGFSIMFKLDESSLGNHLNERRVKAAEDDFSAMSDLISELSIDEEILEEDDPEDIEDNTQRDQPLEDLQEIQDQQDEEEYNEEEDNEGAGLFPDTAIQIQSKGAMGGVQFQFQRSISATSAVSDISVTEREIDKEPDIKNGMTGHRYLSAKEKRLLKKQAKNSFKGPDSEIFDNNDEDKSEPSPQKPEKNGKQAPPPSSQPQLYYKRGQKSKQKKIKEKYRDQDEEERDLRMEILASAGTPKEVKGKKSKAKGKKGDLGQSFNPKAKYHQKSKEKNQPLLIGQQHKQKEPVFVESTDPESASMEVVDIEEDEAHIDNDQPSIEDISSSTTTAVINDPSLTVALPSSSLVGSEHEDISDEVTKNTVPAAEGHLEEFNNDEEEKNAESDDEEKRAILVEENLLQLEEAKKESLVLDSLTGNPLSDDVLLFAVPVCAPYSAILNYKYKVKLVPGTNRRGKAAKTAVHRFIQSKDSTQLEKDLLRSIKDNDLSRYFPGKVKMTIPQQIQRTKQK